MTSNQPRAAQTQQFTDKTQGLPEVGLGEPPFLDPSRLGASERRKLDQHLAEVDPRTGLLFAELYASRRFTSVSQTVVYGARGTDPTLLWTLESADGGEHLTVPACVAKAVAVDDATDPLTVLKFRRDRAQVKADRATEERARRSGRTSGLKLGELKEKESTAVGMLLELDAEYQAAVAARARLEQAELADANKPWTEGFEAEQDRLFDAERSGAVLAPLAERREAADTDVAVATAAAETANGRLSRWMSVETVRLRESGFVVRL